MIDPDQNQETQKEVDQGLLVNPPPPQNAPTMRAAIITQWGDDPRQCIQISDNQPMPVILATECLVRVHASSINPIDWKTMKGHLSIILDPPLIPCFDIAGVVTQVGQNCKRLKVGDKVFGMTKAWGPHPCGGCADFAAVSERCLAKMPENTNYFESAMFPLVGLTTVQSISKYTKDGTKVLILGGSGGVGSFAVQYCKAKGCHVTATCGEKNIELMKELGADEVINYREQNFGDVLAGQDYDLVFDTVGGVDNWNNAERVLKIKGGQFVTIAGDTQGDISLKKVVGIATSWIGRNFLSLINKGPSYSYVTADATKGSTQLLEIRQLIEGGFIKPVYTEENLFRLENLQDAFLKSMEGRVVGKLAVIIASDAY